MDLSLNMAVAEGYTSKSQIARRITEDWASRNMYCVACDCDQLVPVRNNTAVLDYFCQECEARYQLKAKKASFGNSVTNSAYDKKIGAIQNGVLPHYAFLRYSASSERVTDLFLIPRHFFNAGMIVARPPLKEQAQRSGWIGSKILLGELPTDARVGVVAGSTVRDPAEARADWARYTFLETEQDAPKGWAADILICVRKLAKETGSREFTARQFINAFVKNFG